MTPSRIRRRRRCGQRGAAYTETLIMLPFFFIVFGCLLFVTRAFVGKSEVDSRARTCMWQHIMSGCGEPIPGCEITDNPILVGQVPDGASSALGEVSTQLSNVSINVDDEFGDWFSSFFNSSNSATFQRPVIMGGGGQRLATLVTNSCNETPTDADIYYFGAIAFCAESGRPCP